jgi:hypothetical protein
MPPGVLLPRVRLQSILPDATLVLRQRSSLSRRLYHPAEYARTRELVRTDPGSRQMVRTGRRPRRCPSRRPASLGFQQEAFRVLNVDRHLHALSLASQAGLHQALGPREVRVCLCRHPQRALVAALGWMLADRRTLAVCGDAD